jgi:hypothetical protein
MGRSHPRGVGRLEGHDVKIDFLWKWQGSQVKNCPALYEAADGSGYIVQGVVLDDETQAQLRDVGANETAVFVPRDVIDRIRDRG